MINLEIKIKISISGIIGNDGRHYILDLLRTFPPDVNFLQVDGIELGKEARALGRTLNFRRILKSCFVFFIKSSSRIFY